MLFKILLSLGLVMFLTACDGEKSKEIEWQLPLSVPNDPHASSKGRQFPEWATHIQGKAKLVFLEKSTARTFAVELENGSQEKFSSWTIQLQGVAQGLRIKANTFINDAEVSNPAAFVVLYQDDTLMYEGWLYKDFPELFGMDNSHWKVWLEEVIMPPSSKEEATKVNNMLP